MIFTLTLDMILELPEKIITVSEKYKEYSELLSSYVCDEYNFDEIRETVSKKIRKFKDGKYIYKFPTNYNPRINPTYELNESSKTASSTSSKVEKLVEKEIDKMIWFQDFYDALIITANKLTTSEAIYLVDSFFKNKSEDTIAYNLGVCRTTLQKIKKSCLIKVWIEIETLEE